MVQETYTHPLNHISLLYSCNRRIWKFIIIIIELKNICNYTHIYNKRCQSRFYYLKNKYNEIHSEQKNININHNRLLFNVINEKNNSEIW